MVLISSTNRQDLPVKTDWPQFHKNNHRLVVLGNKPALPQLSFLFPHRPTHAIPQWLEIRIVNGHLFNGLLINCHRFLKPILRLIQTIQL
jgi:hypothetical protein